MPDAGVPEASLRALGGAVGQFIVIRFANYLLASSIATATATCHQNKPFEQQNPFAEHIVFGFAECIMPQVKMLARAFLRRAPMPQAHDRAHRAIAPRLAPARRSAAIISRFDVFANGAGDLFTERLQLVKLFQIS